MKKLRKKDVDRERKIILIGLYIGHMFPQLRTLGA